MSDKTLPNDDSDFSLPGRVEESDSAYFGHPSDSVAAQEEEATRSKSRLLVISAIAFAVISAGFFSYYFLNQSDIDSQILDNAAFETLEEKMVEHYDIGRFGSDHAHAALAVFIDGDQIDFSMPQFQVQSKYIHFENDNPYQIHKHATNVPLHMLFTSLGIQIESDCMHLRFSAGVPQKFCADADRQFTLLINGNPRSSVTLYEIEHNDRILISLGDPESVSEQQGVLESFEIHDVPKKNQSVSSKDIFV
ncbi:MAG: hypothetical protein GKS07_05020 [Nitrosopumilus sp.]|nr:MAG: hypothetical protein GKS07_05020 [Nitrosopumilus sp.]